jgi:hypothetical protein
LQVNVRFETGEYGTSSIRDADSIDYRSAPGFRDDSTG